MTWQEAIHSASIKLEGKITDATRNAEYLALHVLQLWSRTEMRKFLGITLTPEEEAKYHEAVSRRHNQEPLQHITGETEFFGMKFYTSQAALIPRPDTEILVEEALIEAAHCSKEALRILDIGTGSGIIALALASKLPSAKIIGIDISAEAIDLATKNKERLGISNVSFEQIDLFWFGIEKLFSSPFDMLISNPPYISVGDMERLDDEVRKYDPRIALTDEADGLSFYRRISELAPKILTSEGKILVEIGFGYAEDVEKIFRENGFTAERIIKDLNGIERVLVIGK